MITYAIRNLGWAICGFITFFFLIIAAIFQVITNFFAANAKMLDQLACICDPDKDE
jgi:hypothetical protein